MPVALGERVVDRILATPGAAKWLPALKSTDPQRPCLRIEVRTSHVPRVRRFPMPSSQTVLRLAMAARAALRLGRFLPRTGTLAGMTAPKCAENCCKSWPCCAHIVHNRAHPTIFFSLPLTVKLWFELRCQRHKQYC